MTDTTTADLPSELDPDDVALPEGVDMDDVVFESDVEAFVPHDDPDHHYPPFNPRNGRYYEDFDPGCAHFDSTAVVAGLEVNCAYSNCSGRTTVEVEGEVNRACPECGEAKMGRVQFSRENRDRRNRHDSIGTRTKHLHDDFAEEMDRLVSAGAGTVASMDYMMCSIGEIPYEEWAEARGVDAESVRKNMQRVAQALGETVTYKTRGY